MTLSLPLSLEALAYPFPTRKDALGRLVANRGFVHGLIRFRYGGLATLHGYTPQARFATALERFVRDLGATVPVVAAMATAPVQSWDVLVCTSRAVDRFQYAPKWPESAKKPKR